VNSWLWAGVIVFGLGFLWFVFTIMSDSDDGPVAGFVVMALGLIISIPGFVIMDHKWQANCRAMDGHVRSITAYGWYVGSNGQSGYSTMTTTYCLSQDGHVLDTE